jgi:hypothetical protein
MKSIVLGIVIVLLSIAPASAAPFLVSDPAAPAVGASFEIQDKAGVVIAVKANQPDGSIHYDLQNVAVGSYTWQVRYVVDNGVWGGVMKILIKYVKKISREMF